MRTTSVRLLVFAIGLRLLAPEAAVGVLLPIGGELQVNTTTTGVPIHQVVAPDGSGGFIVVWLSDPDPFGEAGTIRARRFDASGTPIGSEFQVNTYTTGVQRDPAVGPDGSGGVVVLWQSEGSGGTDTDDDSIQARRYDGSGNPVGDQFQVNVATTGAQRYPQIAPDGAGGSVVVWSNIGGCSSGSTCIQARRYSSAGVPVGGPLQVNTYTTGLQYGASVGSDGSNGFVVVWTSEGSDGTDTSERSVQGRRFTSLGQPLGPQFQVNTYTTNRQSGARVGPDGSGGFVVVWRSDGSAGTDTDGDSVQAQRYAQDGSPVGGQFQVNTSTTSHQNGASVVVDGVGGFVVFWRGGDGDSSGVLGQRYDGEDPVGTEFLVNTYTAGPQSGPRVAALTNHEIVVVWNGPTPGGGDSGRVFAQRFREMEITGPLTTTSTIPGTLLPGGTIPAVLIDPLALALIGEIYAKLKLPDPVPIDVWRERVRNAVREMGAAEREQALQRTRALRTRLEALERELSER